VASEVQAVAAHTVLECVPAGWRQERLLDLCDFVRDGDWIELKDQGGRDFRLLQISNIGTGRFIETGNFRWITKQTFDRLGCTEVRDGDLLVARMPEPTGRAWCVSQLPWPSVTAVDVAIIRPQRSAVDPAFLAYFLNSPRCLALSASLTTGTTRMRLRRADLQAILVPIPDLAEQKAIAQVLGKLDEKVELNRRTSETLEAMTQALFKSWLGGFVSNRIDAASLIAAGVLEVGDGYRAKNSELGPPGLPFIRAGDLNAGFDTAGADVLSEANVAKARSKASRPGDVAFTSKGTIGRFARVTQYTQPFVYSPQICYWRSLDQQRLEPTILYCWMQGEDFRSQVSAVAGQTDMAPYVSLRDQRQMKVPVFPDSQHEVAGRIKPLLDHQALLAAESKTLAALRDLVLPKLLSGELRIRDAEKVVGQVA
jgi:type I restriction enzyme, S subunit